MSGCNKANPWTATDDASITRLWADATVTLLGIQKQLNRGRSAIQRRAKTLGLGCKASRPDSWSPAEDEKLRELIKSGESYAEIGGVLGCTGLAAQSRAKRLGLLKARDNRPKRAPRPKVEKPAAVFNSDGSTAPYEPRRAAFTPLPGTTPVVWTERAYNGCVWPVGGEGADTLSCNEPTSVSYCCAHLAMRHNHAVAA